MRPPRDQKDEYPLAPEMGPPDWHLELTLREMIVNGYWPAYCGRVSQQASVYQQRMRNLGRPITDGWSERNVHIKLLEWADAIVADGTIWRLGIAELEALFRKEVGRALREDFLTLHETR